MQGEFTMHMKYTMDRTNMVENIQINVHLLKYYFEYPWRRTNEVYFKHYHIVKEIAITVFENEVIYANIKKMVTNLKVLHKSIILMLGICASGKHKYFDKLMFRQIFTCLKFCFSGVLFLFFILDLHLLFYLEKISNLYYMHVAAVHARILPFYSLLCHIHLFLFYALC